jgi:hypothetical protein
MRAALVIALCSFLFTTTHGQPLLFQPALTAGPWEQVTRSGTDGVTLSIRSRSGGTAQRQTVTQQEVVVRMYHRQNGLETWEFPEGSLEDRHLRAVDLDATFDAGQLRWNGTWLLGGESREVVLERPHPSRGRNLHPLCGDSSQVRESGWPGYRSLHFLQSLDGHLAGWLDEAAVSQAGGGRFDADREFSITQDDGEPYDVSSYSVKSGGFELRHQNGRNRFLATLSGDGTSFSGQWTAAVGGGPAPSGSAPTLTFHRARSCSEVIYGDARLGPPFPEP